MPPPASTPSIYDIDWNAPWLAHLSPPFSTKTRNTWADIVHADNLHQALNQCVRSINQSAQLPSEQPTLVTGLGRALSFLPQHCVEALPSYRAYESHIALTGQIPTRNNSHDVLNACVWLNFPRTKAVLNRRQYELILADGIQSQRGMARDAITLLDENAALWVTCEPATAQALRQFDWYNALIQPRAHFDHPLHPRNDAQTAVYLFGHALMEKLITPRKAICAHTWIIEVDETWFSKDNAERVQDLDARLADQLSTHSFHTRDFCPLPILGVPHFWQDNADANFYNDGRVFRAGRTRDLK